MTVPTSTPNKAIPIDDALGSLLRGAIDLFSGRAGILVLADHLDPVGMLSPVMVNIEEDDARTLIDVLERVNDWKYLLWSVDNLGPKEALNGTILLPGTYPAHLEDLFPQRPLAVLTLVLRDSQGNVGMLHILGEQWITTVPMARSGRASAAYAAQTAGAVRNAIEARRARQEKEQLEAILYYSADGILTVDRQLRITSFNPAMERLTGWRTLEVVGRFYYDVLRPKDPQGNELGLHNDPLLQAFATSGPIVDREMMITTRDGQQVDIGVTASAVRSPHGEPLSGVLNLRDITRIRENEQLRSTFMSIISHELQTPIAIIKGYASTLRREDAKWDEQTIRGRLEAIEEESDRLHHLVANLLQASRIQAGGLKMDPGPLDLAEMARKVVRKFAARSPNHTLRVHFPDGMPTVWADRERIEEVLLNLLDNAVKYSPNSRLIRIEGQVTDEAVMISVGDKGMGIPLREQGRIFERFQRVDNKASRTTQGAGLGLYICRAILDAHGGHIRVESELGKGSTFSFSLPRMEQAQSPIVVFGAREQRPGA
ncbi:MAG TPA: ATP-binding protein [Ktedonobacterales bacterium]|nr:ATP-binding protein [Ktedonobacterales bacterium]